MYAKHHTYRRELEFRERHGQHHVKPRSKLAYNKTQADRHSALVRQFGLAFKRNRERSMRGSEKLHSCSAISQGSNVSWFLHVDPGLVLERERHQRLTTTTSSRKFPTSNRSKWSNEFAMVVEKVSATLVPGDAMRAKDENQQEVAALDLSQVYGTTHIFRGHLRLIWL